MQLAIKKCFTRNEFIALSIYLYLVGTVSSAVYFDLKRYKICFFLSQCTIWSCLNVWMSFYFLIYLTSSDSGIEKKNF